MRRNIVGKMRHFGTSYPTILHRVIIHQC